MSVTMISIPLDSETARAYAQASAEDQKKLRLLLSLWLREFVISTRPLKAIMDELSDKAQARGLTPEILESLLRAN